MIVAILLAVGVVAFIFTAFQISAEREKLNKELESTNIRATDEFFNDFVTKGDSLLVDEINDSVVQAYGFEGLAVYVNDDSIVNISVPSVEYLDYSRDYVRQALVSDSSFGKYFKVKKASVYQYIRVLGKGNMPHIAVIFYSDAEYINNILNDIWLRNFLRS